MQSSKFLKYLKEQPNKAVFYLYRKKRPIVSWIKANNGSKQDADDVLQDALIILIHKLKWEDAKLVTSPEFYLFGIAKNLWLSELRKRRKEAVLSKEIKADDSEQQLLIDVKGLNLQLSEIGKKCQDLLKLFYFDKLSMVQIAKKLNFRNAKVAKAMKYKCLQKAKSVIKPQKCYEAQELSR